MEWLMKYWSEKRNKKLKIRRREGDTDGGKYSDFTVL